MMILNQQICMLAAEIQWRQVDFLKPLLVCKKKTETRPTSDISFKVGQRAG